VCVAIAIAAKKASDNRLLGSDLLFVDSSPSSLVIAADSPVGPEQDGYCGKRLQNGQR
jgi:hypothetical protein